MHVMATMPSFPTPVQVACVLVLLVYVQLTTQATPPPCNPGDNLYVPVFTDSEVRKTIPETLPTGASVATLRASDNDTVCNFGTLTYNITGDGSAVTYFQIDQDTGTVSVRTSLTNTSIMDFTVRIEAQDGSSPPWIATALLYVKVTRNFVGPVWSSTTYATSIPETAPVLENILRVTATDSDAQPPNNEVSYELVGDAFQLYYFEIVSSTGDIRPRRPLTLDTARRNRFDFVVNARDNGSPRLSAAFNATVTISVYRNNNAPRFIQDPYSITVNQGLGSGTVISVRAVDADPTTEFNQITYSIEGPANALALFTIDGSGNIQPTNPAAINSASQTSYKIYVRAEDSGSPRLYDIALVELTINRNLNPPIFNPVSYQMTILETRPIGDVVVRVTATDADNQNPNNEITFSAFGSGLAFFNVNSQTGEVTVVNNLVQDSTPSYQLIIQAQDKGASPLSSAQPASVIIIVVRNQASPVFVQTPYDTTVLRTAGANTPVVTVTATDADTWSPYNEVTYGIVSMTINRFQINPSTGEIILTQAIASDSQAQYGVTVFAQDGGNPRRLTYNTFTVGVDRNLNAPFLINPSGPNFENSTTVLETIGFDYLIYDVDAFDADLSDPYRSLRFSIIGENTAPTYFLINRDSGEIRLKSSLLQDTLQTLQYRLVIAVTDGGDPPRPAPTTATITVNVIRNLNTPRWVSEPYSATSDETIGANINIVNVLAVDDDTNAFNRVSYAIIGDGTASAYFDVTQGGTIIRKQSLQSVSDTRFYLRVVASDNGVPPKTNTTVVSIIINRNLNTPTFSQLLFTTEIDETTEVGTAVLRISATDQDSVVCVFTHSGAVMPQHYITATG
ncbi:cadherin EGF LAG seven-pass G-type receptor 2-like [Haliotis rufescens]|uniref:cadherin EGF LAG seven-pass G-type receptor 2-like n=1 Tax=Haliotis rufescens TaxID=6454 RepID=UPI00201E9F10|nr:cadherin EGF LAG seven-pass G-type receptor 2-like [Haliotis rufescens]